ncbi:MAG: Tat pathway signal sequence [Coriobacteriales bacterium]|nr:Tat pathway signal sequence [Coriobacteriales bacterium]
MATKSNSDFGEIGSILGSMFGFPVGGFSREAEEDSASADGENKDSSSDDSESSGKSQTPAERQPTFFEQLATWSKRALIILAIVAVLVLLGCYWWFHPAINLHSERVWWWIALICAIIASAFWVASLRHQDKAKLFRKLIIIPIAIVALGLLGKAAGFSFIPGNADRYAHVLETTEGVFAEDIEEADYSQVPVIDRASAILLGNRAMGSIPEYVSQFEISKIYSQINYHGRPVRVSPLNYADLFKWLTNRAEGIPAYVLIDMTTQEAEVVRLENPMKYSESEPLVRNIDRHVQLKYPTYMFDEKSFEIDEDGVPYWIFPVQKRTIGLFDGTTIQRVVLCNASTGECEDYAIEDCPQWVDRAYPSDLLVEQYNWSGLYSGGWLNSWIGQRNVVRTTPGTDGNLGYNYIAQNDDVYLYSGVSSVTADNSIVGFILINQRTGESRFFKVAGATEDSAMYSAEGQVQNLRYDATFPLLLNIEGQPTYFMALKDAAGLVKMFAMVNIEQYQNVAVGNTVAECQAAYVKLLAQQGVLTLSDVAPVAAEGGIPVSGTIATMTQVVIDGNSHFYITLKDAVEDASEATSSTAIYDFPLPRLLEIVTYQPGDAIEFTYVENDNVRTAVVLGEEAVVAVIAQTKATAENDEAVAA